MSSEELNVTSNFIRTLIQADLDSGKHQTIVTRFPPEPNGYLHIGHAKAICLNFGLAADYNGRCHLRFDDTNPVKEEDEYVEAIRADVSWLGFDWGEHLYFTSSYFEQLYTYAVQLIDKGKAYVCSLTPEQIREYRGSLTEPGTESPHRDRSVAENLDLFQRMRAGEFPNGAHVLRAKIDMTSGNLNLRDPILYRILHAAHHRTGDDWCLYPMYDFAHGQSDSLEGVTHSICTLEFADHRPLYDWFIQELGIFAPQQIEFARLNLSYTVMSKRKLLQLVEEQLVSGWDDPRLPTLVGMRRRGYPAAAIRKFCDLIGVGKAASWIELSVLEDCVREELNASAPRAMAVLKPLKVVITNYPEEQVEQLTAAIHPQKPEMGSRTIPFSREIYIEQDDFMEDPPKKFFRLGPGKEVRLRNSYIIRCDEVIKDADGKVVELHCSADLDTLGAKPADGRKVKGIIHWVSAEQAVPVEIRLYDRLFSVENPDQGDDFRQNLNPDSLQTITTVYAEAGLAAAKPGIAYQFERTGYFCVDPIDSTAAKTVFNRIVSLRDSWAKEQSK